MAFKNKHIFTISGKHTATAQASHTASYYHDICILLSCATTEIFNFLGPRPFLPSNQVLLFPESPSVSQTKGTKRTPRKGKIAIAKARRRG
jgi:hypothetical protein